MAARGQRRALACVAKLSARRGGLHGARRDFGAARHGLRRVLDVCVLDTPRAPRRRETG